MVSHAFVIFMHLWSFFNDRDKHTCLVECFQSVHVSAFNDDMMCLLPISLL